MGIEWIGSYCPDGEPHFSVQERMVNKGGLFRCQKCHKHKWLPITFEDARDFETLINKYGVQAAYCLYLDKHQEAKVLIAKLQLLWNLRREEPDDRKFVLIAAEVINNKHFDAA